MSARVPYQSPLGRLHRAHESSNPPNSLFGSDFDAGPGG